MLALQPVREIGGVNQAERHRVNMFFFLPRRVVSRTNGEEFHSLKATAVRLRAQPLAQQGKLSGFSGTIDPSTTMKFATMAVRN